MRRPFRIAILSLLALASLSASLAKSAETGHAAGADLKVEHAEIFLSPAGTMMAGYLIVWNGTAQPADLVGVEGEGFDSITLHKAEFVDGIAKMRPVEGNLSIPAHSELLMKRGGLHLMLSGRKLPVAGSTANLVLVFDNGTRLTANANVLGPGAKSAHHEHGSSDGKED